MRNPRHARWFMAGLLLCGGILSPGGALPAQDPPSAEDSWLEPIPIPFDPELEQQIEEVQGALSAINKQIVRHKEQVNKEPDAAAKAKLYEKLETLRGEQEDLEALLHDLIGEAKASQRTAIDEALRRARWLERQQEYWEKKEELLRDRQE